MTISRNNFARQDAAPPDTLARQDAAPLERTRITPKFLSQDCDIKKSRHHLPHWEQDGTTCFATFRLADSLPAGKLAELHDERERWLAVHPSPLSKDDFEEYVERFEGTFQRWLDAGHGKCVLRDLGVRRIVENALLHFDGVRYALHASVVMPNHVHALFTPAPGHTVGSILQTWKSYTSKKINALLKRTGILWEKESWDRFLRGPGHFARTVEYIMANPGALPIQAYVAPDIIALQA